MDLGAGQDPLGVVGRVDGGVAEAGSTGLAVFAGLTLHAERATSHRLWGSWPASLLATWISS